jgi:hypothetical protein
MTPAAIAEEIRSARADFHLQVDEVTSAELRKRSNGTRWTNDQLLFHMLFGYMIVRTLLSIGLSNLFNDAWARPSLARLLLPAHRQASARGRHRPHR